jgi:uncharacterized protein (DUF1778 family)
MTDTALVTLGFRCTPELKTLLSNSAQVQGLSLSSYVNEIVCNFESRLQKAVDELSKSDIDRKQLIDKLSKYESPIMKSLFEKCKGKSAVITEVNGAKRTIVVNSISDLHEVIVKSFTI